jgi:very-short-patch-repair endonuclease
MTIEPFRGSAAVAEGLVTPGELRGPRFRRLFPDVYIPVVPGADPPDLALRARAAHVLVEGRGVLGGWAAAELLDASCGPADAPVEVIVPGGTQRRHRGLLVRRATVSPDEVTVADGARVTTAVRTAFDLACRSSLREGVVAVDALARVGKFRPAAILTVRDLHRGARGSARIPEVVRRANPKSGSPMETRVRLAIEDAGLPTPALQHPVGDYALDLAFVDERLGVEHNGPDHLRPERAQRDLVREAFLARAGWRVLRFDPGLVMRRPTLVAERIGRELHRIRAERDRSTAGSAAR